MSMGALDVVPGVSGGTIALIAGIYEELIESLANINFSLIRILKSEGFGPAWRHINGNFLTVLFLGILCSILSVAKAVEWAMLELPVILWSFFFGLILASIYIIAKRINKWSTKIIGTLILGFIISYIITTAGYLDGSNNSWWFFVLAGALAICAMILPGISGAFILLILGAYAPILEALNSKNISIISLVIVGAIIGLFAFSKILKWVFQNYKELTLALLTGFMAGSIHKIWPWRKTLSFRMNSKGIEVPLKEINISPINYDGDPKIGLSIFVFLVGIFIISAMNRISNKANF